LIAIVKICRKEFCSVLDRMLYFPLESLFRSENNQPDVANMGSNGLIHSHIFIKL